MKRDKSIPVGGPLQWGHSKLSYSMNTHSNSRWFGSDFITLNHDFRSRIDGDVGIKMQDHKQPKGSLPVLEAEQSPPDRSVAFGAGLRHRVREHAVAAGCKRILILTTPHQSDLGLELAETLGSMAGGIFCKAAMHTPTDVTRRGLGASLRTRGPTRCLPLVAVRPSAWARRWTCGPVSPRSLCPRPMPGANAPASSARPRTA
jgi:hypothetical protein